MANKVKVFEPKPFNGARSAKDLENFLRDIEQYFKAAKVPSQEMVTIRTSVFHVLRTYVMILCNWLIL